MSESYWVGGVEYQNGAPVPQPTPITEQQQSDKGATLDSMFGVGGYGVAPGEVIGAPAPAGDPNDLDGNGIPDWYDSIIATQQTQARQAASAWLQGVLAQYGMGDLAGSVDALVQEWGTNTDVIALKLKETDSYKTRFKGLIGLQSRGINDVRNEAEYLTLESSYRQVFRENGLADFLGTAGTQAEYDGIADLVNKFSLSVNEVRDRVSDAQRAAVDTPEEVKAAMQSFYGIDTTQLVAWSLDPVKTMNEINRQVNAGLAGGYAARAGLNITGSTAEQVAGLYGNQDLNVGQLGQELAGARQVGDATKRLASIDNIDLTNDEILQSALQLDAGAQQKVKTLQSRERARFGGSSAFGTGSLSRNTGT